SSSERVLAGFSSLWSGEAGSTAAHQELARPHLDQAVFAHPRDVSIAVQDIKETVVSLIGIVRSRIGGIGERPGAARVGWGGRMAGVGATGRFSMIPDDHDVRGPVTVGQLYQRLAVRPAVGVVHAVADLILRLSGRVEAPGTFEDFLVSFVKCP